MWSDLDDWLLLGTEIEQGAINKMERPPWLVLQSFKKLLPTQLREQLEVQLPSADFDEALAWVKRQMEFRRGASQAKSFARDHEKSLHELTEELQHAHAQVEAFSSAFGGWDPQTDYAIDLIRKGKGGKGGGKNGRKGKSLGTTWPITPGGPRPGQDKDGAPFKGKCFNCGEKGHRSADCPKPRKERNVSEIVDESEDVNPNVAQTNAEEEAAQAAWFGAPTWQMDTAKIWSLTSSPPSPPSSSPQPLRPLGG